MTVGTYAHPLQKDQRIICMTCQHLANDPWNFASWLANTCHATVMPHSPSFHSCSAWFWMWVPSSLLWNTDWLSFVCDECPFLCVFGPDGLLMAPSLAACVFHLCSGPPKIVTMLVRSDQPDDDFGVSYHLNTCQLVQPWWWCCSCSCFCWTCIHCWASIFHCCLSQWSAMLTFVLLMLELPMTCSFVVFVSPILVWLQPTTNPAPFSLSLFSGHTFSPNSFSISLPVFLSSVVAIDFVWEGIMSSMDVSHPIRRFCMNHHLIFLSPPFSWNTSSPQQLLASTVSFLVSHPAILSHMMMCSWDGFSMSPPSTVAFSQHSPLAVCHCHPCTRCLWNVRCP